MSQVNGLFYSTVSIASGGNTSSAANSSGGVLAGFYIPSTFTGSSVTFTASRDGANYYPVRDRTGTSISVTVNTGTPSFYSLNGVLPFAAEFIRVVSASSEAADRTIDLVFQRVV